MNIKNSIAKWVLGNYSRIGHEDGKSYFPDFNEIRQPFSKIIFSNIVELLTDLTQDTTLVLKQGNQMLFSEFAELFNNDGQFILNRLFNKGFAVISFNEAGFKVLDDDQFTTDAEIKAIITAKKYKGSRVYILKSDTFRETGMSDKQQMIGYLNYLENILNASNTMTARLGTMVMACPVTASGINTVNKISDLEKEKIEKDISDNFGALKSQRQIHIWGQEMAFTTINLAGIDTKTIDKAKFIINVICDRIKVPSNQVSVIDASNTNSLSNGGEMREGDIMKYKSYERLLNKTFVKMAKDLDLIIDYTIYNKPQMNTQQPII